MTKVTKSRDLNRIDREIVRQLTADGRLTNQELAQRIHASESTTSRHRRRLEETGVIRRYTAVVDEVSLGESECVFMLVALRSQNNADKEAFEKALLRVGQVAECHMVTGEADYVVRVICSDMHDYEHVLQRIATLPEVGQVHSHVRLREIIERREVLPW